MSDLMVVIDGKSVAVATIADYAERRHLKVSFVRDHLIKGDDQNEPVKPAYTLNRTGMYSIEELDTAYLTRGTKGITLASMGYLHPAKAAELESRIRELIGEKTEAEANLQESETELEQVNSLLQDAKSQWEHWHGTALKHEMELSQAKADLATNKSNLESAAASLFRAQQLIDSGQKQYDELRDENESLRKKLRQALRDALAGAYELGWTNDHQAQLDALDS